MGKRRGMERKPREGRKEYIECRKNEIKTSGREARKGTGRGEGVKEKYCKSGK